MTTSRRTVQLHTAPGAPSGAGSTDPLPATPAPSRANYCTRCHDGTGPCTCASRRLATEDLGPPSELSRQAFNTPADLAARRQRETDARRDDAISADKARTADELLRRAYDLIGAARDIIGDMPARGLNVGKRIASRDACNGARERIMEGRIPLGEIAALHCGGKAGGR